MKRSKINSWQPPHFGILAANKRNKRILRVHVSTIKNKFSDGVVATIWSKTGGEGRANQMPIQRRDKITDPSAPPFLEKSFCEAGAAASGPAF